MSKSFPRYANLVARASLTALFILILLAAWALSVWYRSAYVTQVGVNVPQAVPFSHGHHVAGLGIDCRYCHTSVMTSANAGMPSTHTCMTCHSQVWNDSPMLEPVRKSLETGVPLSWNRVTQLPDFVYFHHGIHLQKGVSCQACHGRVSEMPLTHKASPLNMATCLGCHRDPAKQLTPFDSLFDPHWQPPRDRQALGQKLMHDYHIRTVGLTDCATCHR